MATVSMWADSGALKVAEAQGWEWFLREGGLLQAGKGGLWAGTCLRHHWGVIAVATAQVRRVGLAPRVLSPTHQGNPALTGVSAMPRPIS